MKKKKSKFFISLGIILVVLFSIVFGGYLALDKFLVPKYFARYGINNMKELVSLVKLMYTVPDEQTFITNPYSSIDKTTAENKLIEVGFPTNTKNELDYSKLVEKGFYVVTDSEYEGDFIYLSDKEIAAIMGQILDSGVLVSELPNLSYLDTITMEVKELSITPDVLIEDEDSDNLYSSAQIKVIIKINLEKATKQMSENLDVPLFLLNMIMPQNVYVTSIFNLTLDKDNNWQKSDSSLSINGKTPKQSEVLLNLLISFIYSSDENMTISNLSDQIADLTCKCFGLVGDVTFVDKIEVGSAALNGVRVPLIK